MTSEDPQVPNPLEPAGDSAQGFEPGQSPSPESEPSEAAAQGSEDTMEKRVTGSLRRGTGALNPRSKARDDYVAELRQTLVTQEDESGQKTGGLIRRITGTLRRVTGPLRGQTGQLPQQKTEEQSPTPPVAGPDLADSFMIDRLSGAPAETGEEVFHLPLTQEEPLEPADISFEETEDETPLFLDQPLMMAEEVPSSGEVPVEEDSDWVSEIRHEAAASEESTPSSDEALSAAPAQPESGREPAPRGSGRLRSFITGIFGGRRKDAEKEEISDELVSGRLQRSLGTEPEQPAAQESTSLDDLYTQDPSQPLRGAAALGEDYVDDLELPFSDAAGSADAVAPDVPLFAPGDFADESAEITGEELFPEDPLASRLSGLAGEPGPVPAENVFSPEITPEDEALIWGDAAPAAEESPSEEPTFSAEDLWSETETLEGPGDRRGQVPPSDDLYAAQFLTGELALPGQSGGAQDNLLREALDQQPAEGEMAPGDPAMADLRAIALEDYDQAAVDRLGPVQGYSGSASTVFDEAYLEDAGRPRQRRKRLTTAQKFLRAFLVVFAVAVVAAAAFVVYMLTRGPVYQVGYVVPRPLPANLPHPIGLVLPGGWQFMLDKSTFVEGEWRPDGGEWLEGTELRRVVALPWNPQTEAVIRTFKPGDKVWLALSNDDMVDYTITEVSRIAEDDTTILSERNPSLVIILYQEDASERWVVFSIP